MDIPNILKRREKEISNLRKSLEELDQNGGFKKLLFQYEKEKKLKTLLESQNTKADQFLISNDLRYNQLAQENMALLAHHDIVFKILEYGEYTHKTTSAELEGMINEQGKSLSYTSKDEHLIPILYYFKFPKEFIGSIDHFGAIKLKTTKFTSILFKEMPVEYFGFIDINGKIKLGSETQSSRKLPRLHNRKIAQLMALHFEGDESSKTKFINNRNELQQKLETFRMGLLG